MSPEDVVNLQLEAYNARNIDAFAATYAVDVNIFGFGKIAPELVGREALRDQYGTKTFKKEGLHASIAGRMVVGNKVIDHELSSWDGLAAPLDTVVIYEVVDDLIQNVWFFDPTVATRYDAQTDRSWTLPTRQPAP